MLKLVNDTTVINGTVHIKGCQMSADIKGNHRKPYLIRIVVLVDHTRVRDNVIPHIEIVLNKCLVLNLQRI